MKEHDAGSRASPRLSFCSASAFHSAGSSNIAATIGLVTLLFVLRIPKYISLLILEEAKALSNLDTIHQPAFKAVLGDLATEGAAAIRVVLGSS